jgi:hypothetical protein
MAHLKWGRPARQPRPGDAGVPPEFVHARESWLAMRDAGRWRRRELARIRAVVADRLELVFVPDNLKNGCDSLLVSEQFESRGVEVAGVDFSAGPIPTVRAKAFFELPFALEIPDHDALVAWQESNDDLDWAISFHYDFDLNDNETVFADDFSDGVEVYGPLAPDDPGRTYAEEIAGVLNRAGVKARTT